MFRYLKTHRADKSLNERTDPSLGLKKILQAKTMVGNVLYYILRFKESSLLILNRLKLG